MKPTTAITGHAVAEKFDYILAITSRGRNAYVRTTCGLVESAAVVYSLERSIRIIVGQSVGQSYEKYS